MTQYPSCPTGNDSDCPDGFNCIPVLNTSMQIVGSYCGDMDCSVGTGSDCAAPLDGNATPMCLQASTPVCTLTCGGGETCPTGMFCVGTEAGNVCVW
jgi:hypothetical protein